MAIHFDCFMQLPRTEALQSSSAAAVISHQFFGALSAQARKALGRAKIQLQKPKQTTTELNANNQKHGGQQPCSSLSGPSARELPRQCI